MISVFQAKSTGVWRGGQVRSDRCAGSSALGVRRSQVLPPLPAVMELQWWEQLHRWVGKQGCGCYERWSAPRGACPVSVSDSDVS